jgi:hypothetical protein
MIRLFQYKSCHCFESNESKEVWREAKAILDFRFSALFEFSLSYVKAQRDVHKKKVTKQERSNNRSYYYVTQYIDIIITSYLKNIPVI